MYTFLYNGNNFATPASTVAWVIGLFFFFSFYYFIRRYYTLYLSSVLSTSRFYIPSETSNASVYATTCCFFFSMRSNNFLPEIFSPIKNSIEGISRRTFDQVGVVSRLSFDFSSGFFNKMEKLVIFGVRGKNTTIGLIIYYSTLYLILY